MFTSRGPLSAKILTLTADAPVREVSDGTPVTLLLDQPVPKKLSGRGGMAVGAGQRKAAASVTVAAGKAYGEPLTAGEKVHVTWLATTCPAKVDRVEADGGVRVKLVSGARLPVVEGDRIAISRGPLWQVGIPVSIAEVDAAR